MGVHVKSPLWSDEKPNAVGNRICPEPIVRAGIARLQIAAINNFAGNQCRQHTGDEPMDYESDVRRERLAKDCRVTLMLRVADEGLKRFEKIISDGLEFRDHSTTPDSGNTHSPSTRDK